MNNHSDIIEQFPLSDAHRAQLHASGISDDVIAERGYWSLTATNPEQKKLLKVIGLESLKGRPGLMIPMYEDASGAIASYQCRLDEPLEDGTRYKSPTRWERAVMMDMHPRIATNLKDVKELWITEGVKKADALLSRGIPCLALMGVEMWKARDEEGRSSALALWDKIPLAEMSIRIIFDSDVSTKPAVERALDKLKTFLVKRDAFDTKVKYLPNGPNGEKVGVDDWLAQGHTVEELRALPEFLSAEDRKKTSVPKDMPLALLATPGDTGNAAWYLYHFGADLRFNRHQEDWVKWDGRRWVNKSTHDAEMLAQDAFRLMFDLVPSIVNKKEQAFVAERAEHLADVSTQSHMVQAARLDPSVQCGQMDFDDDPWLLNCRNGTIDLRTGELRPHQQADLITLMADVEYDPQAKSELWERTLLQIFGGCKETVAYFQRAVGYSLTGDTREECFFQLYGTGRNGKGTVLETLSALLKEYRRVASFKTFLKTNQNDAEGPSPVMASLAGGRIVVASEAAAGARYNDELMKALTGGDEITARFLRENPFTYKPTFKIWLATNHLPAAAAEDTAFWERCKVIPFKQYFGEGERNVNLKKQLLLELQGVLTWCVEGSLQWAELGLGTCPEVQTSTSEYRAEQDFYQQWLTECCMIDGYVNEVNGDLWYSYQQWENSNDVPRESRLSRTAFGLRLSKQFILEPGRRKRLGLKLLTAEDGKTPPTQKGPPNPRNQSK